MTKAAMLCGLLSSDTVQLWISLGRDVRIQGLICMFLRRQRLLSDRVRLGQWGEKRAERYLRGRGLKTLDRHFVCRTGELDLIMVDSEGTLVFVEVKTRANESFVAAETAISPAKKRRVVRAGHYFLACHDLQDRPYRFDVVAIVLGRSGRPRIRHYPHAFTR